MDIKRVNNIKFEAGAVTLKRMESGSIKSYDAIKKIAQDRDMDIFICKNKASKYLPHSNMYLVLASKDLKHGTGCLITSNKTKGAELGVKIYNATMDAVELLENKLKIKK